MSLSSAGVGTEGFPIRRSLPLVRGSTKHGPFSPLPVRLAASGIAAAEGDGPPFEAQEFLVILYTEGARPGGSEATGPPPLSPGNRSCIISTVHHRGSPSSRFTKWKQMNSIKHKPPELWFPFYLVVKEFIHNWHMIFSSGFKSFPNVKRNLSVWGGHGFVSNQSIMPSNGKEGGSPE